MLKIENVSVIGWEAAIRGMRNPLNSWAKSDSEHKNGNFTIGQNDYKLMMNLCKGGTEESKWRRMIHVTFDVTAPLYWWKEADTYKVGTVANSCSTMHKIAEKEFTLDDFSHEHMKESTISVMRTVIGQLNLYRDGFLQSKDKADWWQMIQLLPSSYNQRRTVDLNYEVLAAQYRQRKAHKLDEWRTYCEWIRSLPYSEFIIGEL